MEVCVEIAYGDNGVRETLLKVWKSTNPGQKKKKKWIAQYILRAREGTRRVLQEFIRRAGKKKKRKKNV